MKNKIIPTFWALLACFSLGLSSLQAQTTMTGTQALTALNSTGTIDVQGNLEINGDINMPLNTAATARVFTIKATGNIAVNGNISLRGDNGGTGNTTAVCNAKPGNNLVITTTNGIVNIGNIDTRGGNGTRPVPDAGHANANGGNGGDAGYVTINGNTITVSQINTSGGQGGEANHAWGPGNGGKGGNSGNITITALNDITTLGTIIANAGNAGGNYAGNAGTQFVYGVTAKLITITSTEGAVTVNETVSANGGKGTGRQTNGDNQLASTNGGTGGTISISSCGLLDIKKTITANGGEAGDPMTSVYSNTYNKAGAGGAGGSITINSSNGDVAMVQKIQANGMNGANITCPGMQGDGTGGTTNADRGGDGGAGGNISVFAEKGTLTVDDQITVNAGKGGDHCNMGCGGNGGNGGVLQLKAADGNEAAIISLLAASGANRGTNTSLGAPTVNCSGSQPGVNGTVPSKIIFPFVPPTLIGKIEIECDPVTEEVKAGQQVTEAMLDALLTNYTKKNDGTERWQYNNDNGWTDFPSLPVDITEANKEEYSAYVRLVYTECGVEKNVVGINSDPKAPENGFIDIPCAPIPPEPEPEPEECPKVPNAIIWGGNGGENYNFLIGDTDIEYLTIFNRYGITVFDGGKGQGWDGTYKGKSVDPGTYYYVLKHSCLGTVKSALAVVKEK